MNKIEINKKMIGKKVLVNSRLPWEGRVVGVVNEEMLSIMKSSGKLITVDIYDVRSLENA
tara:strand:+ start:376 stop:555 length:180 start_codon:yes stop_codon:yes gene_type:complete